jgi:hypothetical protein
MKKGTFACPFLFYRQMDRLLIERHCERAVQPKQREHGIEHVHDDNPVGQMAPADRPACPLRVAEQALQRNGRAQEMLEKFGQSSLIEPENDDDQNAGNPHNSGSMLPKLPLAKSNKAYPRDHRDEYRKGGEPEIAVMAQVLKNFRVFVPQAFF